LAAAVASTPKDAPVVFIRSVDGDSAAGIIWVRPAGVKPRLAWAASGTIHRDQGLLRIGYTALPLPRSEVPAKSLPLHGFLELRTWYRELARGDRLHALAAAAGLALLICGLWPLTRLTRWPLVGTFAALAALFQLGPLLAVLRSRTAVDIAAIFGVHLTPALLAGILAGAFGLAMVLLDFALRPSLRESRRDRGRA
ncbi:MAG TPA: hypothetical protein VLH39_06405, partial [Magnetospirillaceae bacterium]|nr:hypothetical protein [Magnetospirillaceae bacterium]